MSDTAPERNSNSKSNLLEVQHVGVTADLQSPLKSFLLSYSSSTETDNNQPLYRTSQLSNAKYNKFLNEEVTNETDTTHDTSDSKILYEMKSITKVANKKSSNNKLTPSKIEFQLYNKPKKRLQKTKKDLSSKQNKKFKKQIFKNENEEKAKSFLPAKDASILQGLKNSFIKLKSSKKDQKQQLQSEVDKILGDLPEPKNLEENSRDIRIGIYPFEPGCAEYLKTHDCPPQILSLALAERATRYATRFWAEVFGSLQICISFLVTFLLQSYRFVLYSIVNILLVEVLHMTSDYLIKPLLAVIFNGFLQPPLIFCFNILSLLRDILEPIADTINNFVKPIATVGRSVRLVHASYNKKTIAKNV